jgi:hypothetical protein
LISLFAIIIGQGAAVLIRTIYRSAYGSTFIELLVALALLGIVVTPFLNLFAFSSHAINRASRQSTAINLCRSQLEKAKANGYESLYDFYLTEQNNPLIEIDPDGCSGFRRETAVSHFFLPETETAVPNVGLLLIEVSVFWQEDGRELSEILATYLAER